MDQAFLHSGVQSVALPEGSICQDCGIPIITKLLPNDPYCQKSGTSSIKEGSKTYTAEIIGGSAIVFFFTIAAVFWYKNRKVAKQDDVGDDKKGIGLA